MAAQHFSLGTTIRGSGEVNKGVHRFRRESWRRVPDESNKDEVDRIVHPALWEIATWDVSSR